jgi:hypothetical protein
MKNGNPTVKAVHVYKKSLEAQIDELLVEFEQHTGLEIDSLGLNKINPSSNSVGFRMNVSLLF